MQQYREVAELLRNFVSRDGDRRADAERDRGHHRRRNHGTIDEIVKGVADYHADNAAVVDLAVVRVAMAPEDEFFEDEEEHDPGQQRREQTRWRDLLRRLG